MKKEEERDIMLETRDAILKLRILHTRYVDSIKDYYADGEEDFMTWLDLDRHYLNERDKRE